MSITIKEIQVKTTVERNSAKPEITEEIIQKLKHEILSELQNVKAEPYKKRKER